MASLSNRVFASTPNPLLACTEKASGCVSACGNMARSAFVRVLGLIALLTAGLAAHAQLLPSAPSSAKALPTGGARQYAALVGDNDSSGGSAHAKQSSGT